jgi:gamma-glutamylputrescine oxidase
MKTLWMPQDQTYWYLNRTAQPACHEDMKVDVAIVGGGMAGLHAAQAWSKRGKKVVVLEQYYCGSGATGKSSGFVTPNAEISFTEFSRRYTPEKAHGIWDFITSGVNDIRKNITEYGFACDYSLEDTLMVATSEDALKEFKTESDNLARFGYKTSFYSQEKVRQFIGSDGYHGGMTYEDTFGINPYLYCQEMKKHLQKSGVMVFEETTVTSIDGDTVLTAHANIIAEHIIVCTDRFMPELGLLTEQVAQVQTFVMISESLTDTQMRGVFPQKNLLVWDSEPIYNYFRMTPHKQLLLGGGNMKFAFPSVATHDCREMFTQLTNYFETKFPGLNIQFKNIWPGLIGCSKDVQPLVGKDKDNPFLYYVTAVAGLPIAAAAGRYSAECYLEGRTDMDEYFSPYRSIIK